MRSRPSAAPAAAPTCAAASSPLSCSGRPSTTSWSPACITASGGGLNSIWPSPRRMPTTMTPKRWRRFASRIVRPASSDPSPMLHLLHRQLEVLGAGGQLDEVHDGRPQRGLGHLDRADLVGRDDPVGAGPHHLLLRVVGIGARDDEEVGPQPARRQDRVDVLGVAAERRDQAAGGRRSRRRSRMSSRLASASTARSPRSMHRVHGVRVPVDDDERDVLPAELIGDDEADAAGAAQDEVVGQSVDHTRPPLLLDAGMHARFDDAGRHEREGVERGADAGDEEADGEDLAGAREVVHLAVADRRHADDRHVERVPRAPPFDHHVADRPDGDDDGQQGDRQRELPAARARRRL